MITSWPKAELHIHLEGSLEPDLAFTLAARNGVTLPYADVAALSRAYRFNDLQSFLDLYYGCMEVLRTARDFADLTLAYLRRAHADGARHVELFFDPQAHLSRGVPLTDVMDGIRDGVREATSQWGISVLLMPCFLRDRSVHDARRTLEALADHADDITGVGLDSAEVGHPPAQFAPVFAAARELGWRTVAHAGEEGPPDYIWQALDELGVERIDHGIRAVEDRHLLQRLAADRVPLTVCPLSNERLQCVPRLAQHPLPALLDAGALVTINSDDPAYFGGYLADNYAAVQREFGLDDETIRSLAAASITASFLPDDRKAALLA